MTRRLLTLAMCTSLLAPGCFTLYVNKRVDGTEHSTKAYSIAFAATAAVGAAGGALGLVELDPEGDRGGRQRFGYALVGMFAAFGLDMIAGGSYGIYGCIRDGDCGDN